MDTQLCLFVEIDNFGYQRAEYITDILGKIVKLKIIMKDFLTLVIVAKLNLSVINNIHSVKMLNTSFSARSRVVSFIRM